MGAATERAEAWGRLLRSVAAARAGEHPSRLFHRTGRYVVSATEAEAIAELGGPVEDVTGKNTGQVSAYWPERGITVRLAAQRRPPSPKPKVERNAWVVEQYRGGRTMAAIAEEAGISKSRVSQIVRRSTT